jgi:hypothetical protein
MSTKVGLIAVGAVLLVALGGEGLRVDSVRAEEKCLPAPNGHNPPGSHWHYRTDPVTQTKCWYLRTDGQTMQKPAAQEEPTAGVTARPPGAAIPKSVPEQAAPGADNAVWRDPPLPAAASDNVWPDPPSLSGGAPQGTAPNAVGERTASPSQGMPPVGADPGKGNDAGIGRRAAELIEKATSRSKRPGGLFLPFVIGLLMTGIFTRWVVRMIFAPRRTVIPDRRRPVRTAKVAAECREPRFVAHQADLAPGLPDNEKLDKEVKEALAGLVRVLERQRA